MVMLNMIALLQPNKILLLHPKPYSLKPLGLEAGACTHDYPKPYAHPNPPNQHPERHTHQTSVLL